MKPFSKAILLKIVAVAGLLSVLSACGLSPSQEVTEKEPLIVEFTNWWGDYTLLVAQEKGLFKKYGVEVQPVYYETFSRALPDLAAGQIDGGLVAIGDAINVAKHTDLKVVAIYDNGSFNTVVSIPEITRIEELEGRRIGVQVGTSYELLISEMLKSVGLSTADVTLVNVDPEDVPAQLGETIEAGFIYEPYTSEALAEGNNLLLKSTQFIGLYPDVIVFRGAVAAERREDIQAFLKAWFEAVEFRQQNPTETRQIIANYFQTSINDIAPDDLLEILTLQDNYELFKKDTVVRQTIYRTAKLNADFLIRMGVLSSQPNLENLLTPAFLP